MTSKEILPESDREFIRQAYCDHGKSEGTTVAKIFKALLAAEAGIEEKEKYWIGRLNEANAIIQSDTKEIAELKEATLDLKETINRQASIYHDQIAEISALKEEVQRLKKESVSDMFEALNKIKKESALIENCNHYFVQTNEHWKKCSHCGMLCTLFHQ